MNTPSEISRYLANATFYDVHQAACATGERSALEIHLHTMAHTPRWIDGLMRVRNLIVKQLGLKDLGPLGHTNNGKPAAHYRVGERLGIFTLFYIAHNEVILTDEDTHLTVKISLYATPNELRITSVVHTHNWLGRVYLWVIIPFHKLIVKRMLRSMQQVLRK
ncbi:MAG: DUF2867 domain-containing protein [Formosimonas sp.]